MEQTTIQSTPMGKVWKVVIASMLGTALIGYAWHGFGMAKVHAQNTHEENEVRLNIIKLTEYRDTLVASSSARTPTAVPEPL